MRRVLQILALFLFAAALALPLSMPSSLESQGATEALTTDMDAKTDDLFNGFGARGTPVDECVREPNHLPPEATAPSKITFSER